MSDQAGMEGILRYQPRRKSFRRENPAQRRTVLLFAGLLFLAAVIFTALFPFPYFFYRVIFANPAPEVLPVLREWSGSSGSFTLTDSSRIVIDGAYSSMLAQTGQVFQNDLAEVVGRRLPIITAASAGAGDIFLTLHGADRGLGSDGYLFEVGDTVTIRANTSKGVFYGTRTALQILRADPEKIAIPKGWARDYPEYSERGFMLDVGRKFFSIKFLEDYVRFMAWYKMNDFHIHFNDNAIGGGDSTDWQHQYAAFRLYSPRFAGLAAKDGYYTEQDIRELVHLASEYGVTITPEIDAPAHALAFTQYRPDLASPNYSKEMLDLGNPATYSFLYSIWNEFLPWFDTTQVDIGADEYALSDANHYRQFVNTLDDFFKGKGKSVRMWGSLTRLGGNVQVHTDITIDVWDNRWANPVEMVKEGFHIINMNDNLLYIVPKAGYFHDYLDTQFLFEQWEPNIFSFSQPVMNLSPDNPHLLGGMFAEWNDKLGSVVSDSDVHARVKPAMQTLSEKLWSGTVSDLSYQQFVQLAQVAGDAPGTSLPQVPSVQD